MAVASIDRFRSIDGLIVKHGRLGDYSLNGLSSEELIDASDQVRNQEAGSNRTIENR
jgi:hypothetical protein